MENKVVNFFILFILSVVPLIIDPFNIDCFYHPKILVIYIACILMIVYYVLRLRGTYDKSSIEDYLLFGYFGLVFLSTVFSIDIYQSIVGGAFREEGFAAISCYIFIYFIASRYYKFSEKHAKYIILAATAVAFIACLQYFGFNPFKTRFIIWNLIKYGDYSTIGNKNFLGSFFSLILPISLFAFIYSNRYIYLASSAIIFLGILAMNTRSSWIAFIVYMIILCYLTFKNKLRIRNNLIIIFAFAVIAIIFNFVSLNQASNRFSSIKADINILLKNPENNDLALDKAGSGRIFIWRRVLKLISERPILGSGPDTLEITFMNEFKDEVKNVLGFVTVDKAHNEYLQIAVTTGIPAILLYLSFIFVLMVKCFRKTQKNIIMIPIFCSIIGYLIQAFFNISVVSVAPIFWALLGISGNLSNLTNNVNSKIIIKENLI